VSGAKKTKTKRTGGACNLLTIRGGQCHQELGKRNIGNRSKVVQDWERVGKRGMTNYSQKMCTYSITRLWQCAGRFGSEEGGVRKKKKRRTRKGILQRMARGQGKKADN